MSQKSPKSPKSRKPAARAAKRKPPTATIITMSKPAKSLVPDVREIAAKAAETVRQKVLLSGIILRKTPAAPAGKATVARSRKTQVTPTEPSPTVASPAGKPPALHKRPLASRSAGVASTTAAAAASAAAGVPLPPIVSRCLRALDEKKAEDIAVIDVRGRSPVTDFLVIVTATSEPHLRALRIALEKELDEAGETVLGRDTRTESGWCVVDAFDVMFHLFLPAQRASYKLEQLWTRR